MKNNTEKLAKIPVNEEDSKTRDLGFGIVRGVCNFLGSVSLQQRFEMADQCYSSVTAEFYLASKGKYTLKAWGGPTPKETPQSTLASPFIRFVSSPPSLTYANWASQDGCLFHLRFSLQSSDFLSFHFCGLFLSLTFSHHHFRLLFPIQGFPGDSVKNLPAMQETWVQSLGWEDPLEKGMATHFSILAWRIPWTILSVGSQRVRHNWATFTHFLF